MRNPSCLCLLAASLFFAGCGSATYNPDSVRVTPTTNNLKTLIEGIAQSGSIGSGAMDLQSQFDALKASDSAKADAIKAEFDAFLASDGNPAKCKKLAAELAKKL